MIDMHCHLDRYPNPKWIAERAKTQGVTIIAVTNLPSHFRNGFAPASQLSNVRLSLGLHPMLAPHSQAELRLFSELLPKTSYIGEIGLDLSKDGIPTRDAQIQSFNFALEQIQRTGKVLSLHSRKAESEVIDLLQKHAVQAATFHWFTGDDLALRRLIDLGHYLSVNPAMLRSSKGRRSVLTIPKEKVLLETDGPYCTVENRPAEPWDIGDVATGLAQMWDCSKEKAVAQINQNFKDMITRRQESVL